jgi:hypothetical protein
MPAQCGAAPRLCVDEGEPDAEPVLCPDELVRDLARWQLVALDNRHFA